MTRALQMLSVVAMIVLVGFGGVAGAGKEQKVTITMTEFKFAPARITLQAGIPAELILINKGKIEHEFMVYAAPKARVSDWDEYVMANTYFKNMGEIKGEFEGIGAVAGTSVFEVEVQPGQRAELKFTPTRKGTFEIGCHVEGHYEAGMKSVLVVR